MWSWKGGLLMPRHGSNIRRRIDGRWEGRYKSLQADNSYKYKSVYGKTCREVKEKLEKIRAQNSQLISETSLPSRCNEKVLECFGEISLKWLESIKEIRKYSTYIKYRGIYEKHIKDAIGCACICEITNEFINENIFRKNMEIKYSNNLKHSIIAVINQILRYASENYKSPAVQLANKSVRDKGKKIEIINRTDQAALVRYLYRETDTSKAGILLCIFTGLRLGEVCSLKWEDVDFEQKIIYVRRTVQRIAVSKNQNRTALVVTEPKSIFSVREIPISEETAQILKKIRHDDEYVIGGRSPLEPRTYQNRFKRYLKEITARTYNFHALRHTFATNCIDNDMDVKSLSEILGHANVQITLNRYVHPTMDTKRRQIAVLDSVYGQFCGNAEL